MRSQNVIPSLFLDFMQMQEFAKDPLVFVGGEGIRLTTPTGKKYIDGLSGVFVTSLGHGNLPVIEAMTAQLQRLAFAPPLHSTSLPALKLTEILLQHRARGCRRRQVPERRLGGDRGRDEAGAPVSPADRPSAQVQDHQPLRRLPRRHDGGAVGRRRARPQVGVRAARRRLPPRPSAVLLPLPVRPDLPRLRAHLRRADRDDDRGGGSRDGRRGDRRADLDLVRGLHGAAAGLSAAPARDLRPPQRRPDLRRDHHRVRPPRRRCSRSEYFRRRRTSPAAARA